MANSAKEKILSRQRFKTRWKEMARYYRKNLKQEDGSLCQYRDPRQDAKGWMAVKAKISINAGEKENILYLAQM
jgi:hypothetical protein